MSNKPGDYLPPLEGSLYADLPTEIIAGLNEVPVERFILLTLPFPVSANRYWRFFRNHPVRSDEADIYKAKVAQYCTYKQVEPLEGDLRMLLYFYRFNAARDLDNCLKVTIDALKGFAYVDDNQIADLRAIRDYDSKRPRAHVLIYRIIARDEGKIKSRKGK